MLLSQGYEGKANVDKVAGAVGPLYYCMVNIAGEPLKTHGRYQFVGDYPLMGCIPSHCQKGPCSSECSVKVTLRNYSQRPILVGTMVDLEVEFCGKKVVVLIYLCAARHAGSQPCLFGTNDVVPLGLMYPAVGVEPFRGENRSNSTAIVQLGN